MVGSGGANGSVVCPPPCLSAEPAPPGCGDGILSSDEACDDGNREDADGCAGNCLSVGQGFSCNPPGQACHRIAKCGDGVSVFPESCDDGNRDAGDGCSPTCKLELGYQCSGTPSVCTPTICGNGMVEGAESCDDSNTIPFDGCSANCQAEPSCSLNQPCTSACGDGLVLAEECDDGNSANGDGCSASCTIEPGYVCSQDASCETRAGQCVLQVPALFRDFDVSHADFEVNTDSCQGDPAYASSNNLLKGWSKNLLLSSLDAAGKPELDETTDHLGLACITSAATFFQWYHDTNASKLVSGSIVLWQKVDGGFVNRYGEMGEQWPKLLGTTADIRQCGTKGNACAMCTLAAGEMCFDPCAPLGDNYSTSCAAPAEMVDGDPLFFPVDPGSDATATIPPAYTNVDYYLDEKRFVPTAGTHNFYFTTEVKYWFRFDSSTNATLDFTGDDDVWVFVNGKIAVDLGGLHAPINGSVTINAQSAAAFGLVSGNVYPISIFHAERKKQGSSMKLTLDGFTTSRSDCVSVCGDGIVGLGEECDDGTNDGGYGECDAGCILGAYCGDGIVQEGEDCDDGNTLEGDDCGSACRVIVVK